MESLTGKYQMTSEGFIHLGADGFGGACWEILSPLQSLSLPGWNSIGLAELAQGASEGFWKLPSGVPALL